MRIVDSLELRNGQPFHTFEFFPPRTPEGLHNLLDRIHRMTSSPLSSPLAISVTWGAGGSTASRSLELAAEISKLQLANGKVDIILHLTCTNMGKKMVDEALKRCKELGVQNILALRGDPPRKEEYRPSPGPDKTLLDGQDLDDPTIEEEEQEFEFAEDLVRYIDREWKGWFCVGVAGYPTPHADSTSPESDIRFLAQKVHAGAHFIITQLFYDVEGFFQWVKRVRAAGVDVPIIPGIMPIQNYASFRRLTNLCKCPIPEQVLQDLESIKSDDAAVKLYGIELSTKMIKQLVTADLGITGVHFCTLNLEKSVRRILENLHWSLDHQDTHETQSRNKVIEQGRTMAPNTGASESASSPSLKLQALSISPSDASHLAEDTYKSHQKAARENEGLPVTPAKGRGQHENASGGGAEDTWDEFPNGRFTDVRSPAYGEIDGWGNGLKITPAQAIKEWGTPVDIESLSSLFVRYLQTDPSAPTTPFCDLPISPESHSIFRHLIALNSPSRGWWTVGSQPAVDGAKSEDPIHGFGPKGGYVFQKSFVEFFVKDQQEADRLLTLVNKEPNGRVSMYAGNKKGDYLTNMTDQATNAVTWAVFPGQEIVQSTIIEEVSFLAWKEEAFEIWTEWARLFPLRSASRKLLENISQDSWLVSLIHHDYKDPEGLWRFLLEDQ